MRILVTGPECSGKSTLCEALSNNLGIPWFPEYARTYLMEHGPDYKEKDLLEIAKTHARLYHTFPPDQSLILDTYLLNLQIWSVSKYGRCYPWITKQLTEFSFDKVLLMAPDLEWEQDGLREQPHIREELLQLFQQQMANLGWNYKLITGKGTARLDSALQLITTLSV